MMDICASLASLLHVKDDVLRCKEPFFFFLR